MGGELTHLLRSRRLEGESIDAHLRGNSQMVAALGASAVDVKRLSIVDRRLMRSMQHHAGYPQFLDAVDHVERFSPSLYAAAFHLNATSGPLQIIMRGLVRRTRESSCVATSRSRRSAPRGPNQDQTKRRKPAKKSRRWVIEVCHSWFNRFRKLLVRYEKLHRSFMALNHLAAANIVFRKVPLAVNIYGYNLRVASWPLRLATTTFCADSISMLWRKTECSRT